METTEVWKDIPGYEGIYMISNVGNIKKLRYVKGIFVGEKILKTQFNKKSGFLYVHLSNHYKRQPVYIHILVAKLFIPNPLHLKYIIHVNGDRSNNHVENLRWSGAKTIVSDLPKKKIKKYTRTSKVLKAFKSLNTIFSNMSKEEYSDYHAEIENLFQELLQYKLNIENELT